MLQQIQRFTWLPLLCLGLSQTQMAGADRPASGREIYRHLCAKCHGRNGEGVKGKYDDGLRGDWSIEKLTRYIDKSMPEDAPEKCVGRDAAEVAGYIHDAFYSRAARARRQPARIELARLTNRQYVNTIADLLQSFTENDGPVGQERGLRAVYYATQDFNRQFREGTDGQVHLDFGTNHPNSEQITTNGFSMRWRGALIADETGEYQFILKTPNGARLWLNNENKPLIDASVASGDLMEHKATLRLIGNRSYPLRLEFFKAAKDKVSSIALLWKPPYRAPDIIPARHLSPAKVRPTFVLSTPLPPDDSSVGYERGVSVSKAWDEATTQAAVEVANHVVEQLDRFSHSQSGETNRVAKVQAFCADFVARAFRRPLSVEQKRVFVSNHFKKGTKPEDAVKRVVLFALKSPRFLYLGLEGHPPDDFEVAARLSFSLWDSLPDRSLAQRAAQGALQDLEQVRAQAQLMLQDPRAHAKMRSFLHQWLQMDRVENLSKDDKLFPGFTPEIIADLRTSLDLFLDDVVWSNSSDYRRLLLEDDLFVNDRLARFYQVATHATDDFTKVAIEPEQRAGVITHPYLLAAFSYPRSTSPIHRGVFLTRNIVGRSLKPPPMAQVFKDSDFAPNLTMREKVAQMTRSQACQSCHSVINPLGFSLEHFDAVGRLRTQEGDHPIDATSDYVTDDGAKVHITGARDVAQFALSSDHAKDAFIEQLFHQIVKQPMLAYGAEIPNRLRRSFIASGFNIQTLVVDIVMVAAGHGRERPTDDKVARGK